MLFRMILAACAGCLFATAVAAQTQTTTEAEIIRLLKIESGDREDDGLVSRGMLREYSSTLIKKGDEKIIEAALDYARTSAGVALYSARRKTLSRNFDDGFIKEVYNTGIDLSFYTIYTIGKTPEGDKIKGRVTAYLSFARDRGHERAGIWLDMIMRGNKPPNARKDEQPEATFQAAAAIGMKAGNENGFYKKYVGRLMQIDGPVSKVTENGVFLVGKPNDESNSHGVFCAVNDPKERGKLDDVMPGANLTVKGVYFGALEFGSGRLELVGCHVVNSSTPAFGAPTQQ